MTRVRARELGFDACMYMLHKTFGAPKGGGGPAVGAYGCGEELVEFLPRPLVARDGDRYRARLRRAAVDRPGARVLGQRPAGRQGLLVDARDGRRRAARRRRPLGPGAKLHGPPADAGPRRDARAPASRRGAAGDDALLAGDRDRGHRDHRVRRPEPDGRLRRRRVLAQPRALAAARAVHAGARGAVVEGGHRPLDRRARARHRGGVREPGGREDRSAQPGDPPGRRRRTSTTPTRGPRRGASHRRKSAAVGAPR